MGLRTRKKVPCFTDRVVNTERPKLRLPVISVPQNNPAKQCSPQALQAQFPLDIICVLQSKANSVIKLSRQDTNSVFSSALWFILTLLAGNAQASQGATFSWGKKKTSFIHLVFGHAFVGRNLEI